MNNLSVRKDQLLETLRTNKEAHHAEFLEAQKNYRKQVIAELDKRLEQARKGGVINLGFALPEPVEYTDTYDSEIQALEWHIGDTVELTQQDFNRLVLNKWPWAQVFAASTSIYNQGN